MAGVRRRLRLETGRRLVMLTRARGGQASAGRGARGARKELSGAEGARGGGAGACNYEQADGR
jgi:hypothetical protein